MSDSLWLHGLQHPRLPCPSLSPRVCSNSCPSSWWCHPTILSSVAPFSSCPQSFPASRSFPVSQLFALGGQCIAASTLASVLPMVIQHSLAAPSFSLHPLPSLSSNYLSLLFGTQGGSWRLEPISYKQQTGDTEGLPSPGAPQGLAQFQVCGVIFYVATGNQKESISFLRDNISLGRTQLYRPASSMTGPRRNHFPRAWGGGDPGSFSVGSTHILHDLRALGAWILRMNDVE